MKEVTIKAHTRKSKKGKTVSVHSYSRRVGHKGTISPKRSKEEMGEEYKKRLQEASSEKEIKEESAEEPVVMGPYYEANRKFQQKRWEDLRTGKSAINSYKRYKKSEEAKDPQRKVKNAADSKKRRNDFMSKIEDKIASFISRHSKSTYKRYL